MKPFALFLVGAALIFTATIEAKTVTCETRQADGADLISFNFSGSLLDREKGTVYITSKFGLKAQGLYEVERYPCPSQYCGDYSVNFNSYNGKVIAPIHIEAIYGFFGFTKNEIRQDVINYSYKDGSPVDFGWLVNCQ